MKEINCPNCNQHIKILGTDYDLYLENLKKEEQEIKRLKEEYVMLQNASDKVEEEKDKEIETLKADIYEAWDNSTWWRNRYNAIVKQNDDNHKKLVKEQEKIEKAIEYINWVWNNTNKPTNTIVALRTLENILRGSDKE